MKMKFFQIVALATLAVPLRSAPLNESTFTEVINNVEVVAGADKSASPAKANELFKAPDLVRTGADSRAELTAPDRTVTRVGANTVFSFEPAGRNLNLEQGSVLFHPPKGMGGGTIKSGGVAAAVLGTTLIVSATADGGIKTVLLEGKGRVTLANGKSVTLKAGQLVYVQPGGTTFSPVLDINLAKLVAGSQLVNGFSHELTSLPLIQQAVAAQNSEIASGRTVDTGVPADNFVNPPGRGNGLDTMDPGVYQVAMHPPLTPAQLAQLTTTIRLPGSDFPTVLLGNPGGRGFTSVGALPASTTPGKP
jgi:FecR protein